MDKRTPKDTDQEVTQRAFDLLKNCMDEHPEIETTLWAGAFWTVLVDGYSKSGFSYEMFAKEWDEVKNHYKPWFE